MLKATPHKVRKIKKLREQGKSRKAIAEEVGLSEGTVSNVLNRLAGKAPPTTSPPAHAPAALDPELAALPDDADDVSPALDVEYARRLVRRLERAASAAESASNFAGMASITQKIVALLEHVRKSTPKPKEDPNANPDMIAARDEALARMHKLVQQAIEARC